MNCISSIALRLTNEEIAALLRVSEQTVKNQIHRLVQKLGASKRQDAVGLCGLPKYIQEAARAESVRCIGTCLEYFPYQISYHAVLIHVPALRPKLNLPSLLVLRHTP